MNYAKILKRGWDILWSYKTLWVFGIILALTTSSGFNGGSGRSSQVNLDKDEYNFNLPSDVQTFLEEAFDTANKAIFSQDQGNIIAFIVILVVIAILLSILFAIAKYVSQTALIKMVDTYEASGEKVTWRQGFKLGWSRQAWQLFLINLVIFLPITILTALLLGCALIPVLTGLAVNNEPTVTGIIASVGLFFLIIFIAVVFGVILSLFMEVIYRECVLKGSGVIESIRIGWRKVTHNFKDVFLMWLILIGIRFGYFLFNIPVVIFLVGIALLVGGGIGVAVYFIVNAIAVGVGWVAAAIVGGFIFLLLFSTPKLFLDGLFETYISSVWTLTYRELNDVVLNQELAPGPDIDKSQKTEDLDSHTLDEELPSPI